MLAQWWYKQRKRKRRWKRKGAYIGMEWKQGVLRNRITEMRNGQPRPRRQPASSGTPKATVVLPYIRGYRSPYAGSWPHWMSPPVSDPWPPSATYYSTRRTPSLIGRDLGWSTKSHAQHAPAVISDRRVWPWRWGWRSTGLQLTLGTSTPLRWWSIHVGWG